MTVAESPNSIAAEKLRRMVALSTTFQAGRNYQDALKKVFRKNVIGSEKRPFVSIAQGDSHELTLFSGGDHNFLIDSGSLFLYMTKDTNPSYYTDNIQAETDAENYFGLIVRQVANLSAKDDPGNETSHLSITNMSRVVFDENNKDTWSSLGRFYFAGYLVRWGIE